MSVDTSANGFGHWLRVNGGGGAGTSFNYSVRRVRAAMPTAVKREALGTDGKLGKGRVTATTAGQGTLEACRSAERQYFDGVDRAAARLARLAADHPGLF